MLLHWTAFFWQKCESFILLSRNCYRFENSNWDVNKLHILRRIMSASGRSHDGCTNGESFPHEWMDYHERCCSICRIPLHSVIVIVKQSLWILGAAWVLAICVALLCSKAPLFLGSTVLFLYHYCQSVYLFIEEKNNGIRNMRKMPFTRYKMFGINSLEIGCCLGRIQEKVRRHRLIVISFLLIFNDLVADWYGY